MDSIRDIIISTASGAVPKLIFLFIPQPEELTDLIIDLISLIIALLVYLVLLQIKQYKLKKALSSTQEKHQALASQFTEKQNIITGYERADTEIRHILSVALMRKNETKIMGIAEAIHFQLNHVKDEEGNNG